MIRLPGDRSPCTIRSRRRMYTCSGRDPCGAVATSPVARFARVAGRCGDLRPDAIRAPSSGIDDVQYTEPQKGGGVATCLGSRPVVFHHHETGRDMSMPLDEFFSGVQEEFGVAIDEERDIFDTPGAVIDY